MKTYKITVNGTAYDVVVEEVSGGAAPVSTAAPAPVKAAAPAPAPKAAGAGSVKITSPMPGKILAVKAAAGAAVKKGDVLIVLEAMKMENEIVAPQDGVVASVDTSEGASVEAGDVLASMN
ncbi:MAG: biotin/lipoyl-containing protein [Lachnospiraceae bacterium]|nr:biotin/lipoyl-containing protein [Lachnospiraceae bacterium]